LNDCISARDDSFFCLPQPPSQVNLPFGEAAAREQNALIDK
jgi:hypothetical protein